MTPEDRTEFPESHPPRAMAANGRRRLLRGGLATAPALLTLVNRPVMAGTCMTASASGSMNVSRPHAGVFACTGAGPGVWGQESSSKDWPAPAASPDTTKSVAAPVAADAEPKSDKTTGPSTLNDGTATTEAAKSGAATTENLKTVKVAGTTFNSVFGTQGGYGTKTLTEVLRTNSESGRDGLARYLVAAYLNALKGLTAKEVLDVPTVKSIWTSYVARGYYEPTAGIRWFPDHAEPASPRGGLIAWIKTTMTR